MAFNTPGSRIDRELTAEFTMNRFKTATLNIRTPWKRATVNGQYVGLRLHHACPFGFWLPACLTIENRDWLCPLRELQYSLQESW